MEERLLLNRIELQCTHITPWNIEFAPCIKPHPTDTVPARRDFAVVSTCVTVHPILFVGQFFVQEALLGTCGESSLERDYLFWLLPRHLTLPQFPLISIRYAETS